MNTTQLQLQSIIGNFVANENEHIIAMNESDPDGYQLSIYECIFDSGILVHFGDDGSICFDGDILSAIRCCSEYGYLDNLAEEIQEFLWSKDYTRAGFGVWTLDA